LAVFRNNALRRSGGRGGRAREAPARPPLEPARPLPPGCVLLLGGLSPGLPPGWARRLLDAYEGLVYVRPLPPGRCARSCARPWPACGSAGCARCGARSDDPDKLEPFFALLVAASVSFFAQ
jgi:hypothetical protein